MPFSSNCIPCLIFLFGNRLDQLIHPLLHIDMGGRTASLRALALLCLAAIALAHGDDTAMDMDTGHTGHDLPATAIATATAPTTITASAVPSSEPESYFAHPQHSGVILGHIVLMVLAWFFILPIGSYMRACQVKRRKKKTENKARRKDC